MRVLFFTSFVSLESGASHALLRTVKRVQAFGVEPTLVIPESPDSREMFPSSTWDVVYLPIERPRRSWDPRIQRRYLLSFPRTLFSLRKIIHEKQVDLVHFNEITDSIAGMAAKSVGIPSICHVRCDCPPQPYRWLLLRALAKTTEAIVVPSKSTAGWIRSAAKALTDKIRLVYDYAFDVSEYDQSTRNSEFRAELDIPADSVLVVLVSKLTVQKGHQCFIRAAEIVLKRSPEVHFVIVGDAVPGHANEASEIRRLAQKLVPQLRFVGRRSDLPAIYSACDIAVHCPIYPDPYPTVVLLPMLAGRAVIGTRIGGIPEQIENEKTGLLVPPDDPHSLATAILRLAMNRKRCELLGVTARDKLRAEMTSEAQGRILADIYADVLRETCVLRPIRSSDYQEKVETVR